jgi:peptidyl-prolyl cis-trans isomerase D
MSIIQTIRDKAAWIIIAAIAVALIAFIVQDAFSGRSGGGWFGGNSTTIGKINGTKVDVVDFDKKYNSAEANYTAQGQPVDDQLRQQIRESLWNEYVSDAVLNKEFDKLGFISTEKETGDILYGPNPPQQLAQQFRDANGNYDAMAAYNAIKTLKQQNPAQFRNFWEVFVPALEKQRFQEKFMGMIANSYYVPKWLVEKRNVDNNQIASISYVSVPYTSIADSTIKVSDDEIAKYIADHKKGFPQEKERGIEYVSFDASASAADSAAVREQVEKAKDSFAVTADIKSFLLRENSQTPYYESPISRKEIKIPNIDTIIKTPVGGVFGPYLDGGSYVLARIVDAKMWPDSVKVRHILVSTHQRDQRTGDMTPVRYDTSAKRLIDSVELAIRGGANFDTLCLKYSDDGTRDKGGIYDGVVSGRMTPAFNDFIFGKPVGSKGVVKTEYGYHYIEVLSQKGSSMAYNIAYYSQPVIPSEQTINTAQQQASTFAGESRNKQQFEDNAKKKGLNKFNGYGIKPMESTIPGLGSNRDLIRWMFKEASVGDVAPSPFFIGEKYIVPILANAFEKGTMPVAVARPLVEYKIRNEKKAQQIIQKAGSPASLDAVAKTFSMPVQQLDSVAFSAGYLPNIGNELKLIGASFNKNNQTKVSDAIAGEIGVFYVKVNNITALPNAAIDIKQQQQAMSQQSRMSGYMIIETLKKNADVTDNRYMFY